MRKLLRGLEKGALKPDMEIISSAQRMFEGQVKLINAHVAMFQTTSKNDRAGKHWQKMNLTDDTAIDLMLGDPEEDKVKCPERDDLITRADCLDYSGSYADVCSGCETGKATKKILLPLA